MLKTGLLHNCCLKNLRVLIRVDFNIPIEKGVIRDDARIRAALPTIRYVLDQGGKVILLSHLGRPGGRIDPCYSLEPCAKRLSELLNHPVKMAPDCVGSEVEKMIGQLKPGDVLLLENVRFHLGEERPEKEPLFARSLAQLGDFYINDAFGAAHRAHASTTHIASFFPGKREIGCLMEKEILFLNELLLNPKRPFCAILGGSKISTKFKTIETLMQKADFLLIGGAMAFTFFKAQGIAVGNSLVENDFLPMAHDWLARSSSTHCRLLLPNDLIIVKQIAQHADNCIVKIDCRGGVEGIPDGYKGVDIGPATIASFERKIMQSSTVFWNGPMGVFETPPFDKGTEAIARCLAKLKEDKNEAVTVVGGGDSAAAIEKLQLNDSFTHISTGGGAALEYIENGTLPGIESIYA